MCRFRRGLLDEEVGTPYNLLDDDRAGQSGAPACGGSLRVAAGQPALLQRLWVFA